MRGTAPERAASWLLVEHAGPWPSSALPGDLPSEARQVLDRAEQLGIRPQLVRRVTERRRPSATVMAASCRSGNRWLERVELPDLRALADLDLVALADGQRPEFGAPAADPVVLVCTHGRRDVCCARLGRPLARLLDAQLPGQVWETTHVGGDRFAPNVVALPDGSYHGGIEPVEVPQLAASLTAGRVLPTRLRGRAGLSPATQAAECFLRESTGESAVQAVVPVTATPGPGDETCVELLCGAVRWCVHVAERTQGAERLTSCADGGTTAAPAVFELRSLRRLP